MTPAERRAAVRNTDDWFDRAIASAEYQAAELRRYKDAYRRWVDNTDPAINHAPPQQILSWAVGALSASLPYRFDLAVNRAAEWAKILED